MPPRQQIAKLNATNTVTILLDRFVGPDGRPPVPLPIASKEPSTV